MTRINQNIMAFNAHRNLARSNMALAKSLEKLSSGFRINRAADDASGLVISQNLRKQISGLRQATRNAQDGISVVQTAEGALTEVHTMLNRIRDLAVQAANTGSNDATARQAAQDEIDELRTEIDRIGATTSFGSKNLLDGSFGVDPAVLTGYVASSTFAFAGTEDFDVSVAGSAAVTVSGLDTNVRGAADFAAYLQAQIRAALAGGDATAAANADNVSVSATVVGGGFAIEITGALADTEDLTLTDGTGTPLADLGFTTLTDTASGTPEFFQVGANNDVNDRITVSIAAVSVVSLGVAGVDVTTGAGAQAALDSLDLAISSVSSTRGSLGAKQNRFESTISNLQVTVENLAASESRIRDTDVAFEMVEFTRHQILQQAGTAMLGQATAVPQSVLRLLG